MIRFSHRKRKPIAVFLLVSHLIQLWTPQKAMALTSGPSQPEVQSFQPAGTSEMVDLFTGDFGYNIPLLELPGPNGGYPFNLSYQAGITMDQEASWVGLGFNLNPGTINRQMRGLPDEFDGDPVYTKMSIDPSVTVGLGFGVGAEFFGRALEVGLGFSVYQNNFRGLGYSIDGSLGYGKAINSGTSAGIGLNFSLDSKEGINASPSLSLATKMGQIGVGAAYNSKSGLSSITMSYDTPRDLVIVYKNNTDKADEDFKAETVIDMKSSATLSLSHPGYTPQVSMPMENLGLSATFKIGTSWWGVYPEAYVTGFYNEQRLAEKEKRVRTSAYGYLNYQHATGSRDLMDFNRENDGMVTKDHPNLAIPSLTYDIYSVTGQGISSMYRPIRNDIGVIHDPESGSTSIGGSAGVDAAIPPHVGVNLSVNHSRSRSGLWEANNEVLSKADFQDKVINDLYEPWYFKVHGEPSSEPSSNMEALGKTEAVRVQLEGDNHDPRAKGILENGKGWSTELPAASSFNRERKPRNQVIQPLTNEQLLSGNQEVISLFKILYDSAGYEKPFTRGSLPKHHTAGYTALTPEGLRYNYGIPAYNLYQEEVVFSAKKKLTDTTSRVEVGGTTKGDPTFKHSNTDKFLKRTELPKYAHAYLLTSIVGPDYVDVSGNGVTEDDLGYWVKFTYRKTTTKASPFKWRDPYSKAHLQEGWKTDPRDDRGSFVYGEKELWYLVKAETKSHIVTFTLEPRQDGKGVAAKLQDADNKGESVQALKEIKMFTRSAGVSHPLKVVKFEYDYSLCKGVFNNVSGQGKLTLKKVWFEYGNSQRGRLNPYVFHYHEDNAGENPGYGLYTYNRWGNYKPYPAGDVLHNIDFPYAEQDPAKKSDIDRNAAVWNLKEVELPSGGKVIVDYESDDYGYVQHQPAMQMAEIVDPGSGAGSVFTIADDTLKVRFRLETPIAEELSDIQKKEKVLQYLDQKRQLYFKLYINLRSVGENFYEYVSGYADIDFTKPNGMGLEKDSSGKYVYGFFYLKAETKDNYHPFSLRVWQHLRTNQPDLANSGKRLESTSSTNKRVEQIRSLGSIGAQIRQMFEGYYNFCDDKHWGREIVAGKSWIRLYSPDKIKYGGGCRVRQITLRDQWSQDEEGVYGQVYEYTTEENGSVISSGVAAYEPLIGGDENALRYAKKFSQSVPLRSDNNFFFEYPINESYYPGPMVGYGKVTVTSLAAASLMGKEVKNITLGDNQKLFPAGSGISYGTTGATTHEFYTARDFPVLTEETEKKDKPYQLAFSIPFYGSIAVSKLASSQGYSIITNDMHGKPRQVSNYRQDAKGMLDVKPISWVRYNYAHDTIFYQEQKVSTLVNTFKPNSDGTLSVLESSALDNPPPSTYTIGQENEFFIDMREFEDKVRGGGASYNTDFVYLLFGVFPIPTSWPNISRSDTQLRTAVTNKVIFKTGILESTEAYDGGSHIITKNIKWDKLTGVPVLTVVNNNFDEPVYNYTVLAHTQYQGMGAAYQNIGLTFEVKNVDNLPYHNNLYQFSISINEDLLAPGDEILLYDNQEGLRNPVAKVVYTGEENDEKLFYSATPLTANDYKAMIVRSGYRNQLAVSSGTITALQDPSIPGSTVTYEKVIRVPKEN